MRFWAEVQAFLDTYNSDTHSQPRLFSSPKVNKSAAAGEQRFFEPARRPQVVKHFSKAS